MPWTLGVNGAGNMIGRQGSRRRWVGWIAGPYYAICKFLCRVGAANESLCTYTPGPDGSTLAPHSGVALAAALSASLMNEWFCYYFYHYLPNLFP
jgi:hypothetical protein